MGNKLLSSFILLVVIVQNLIYFTASSENSNSLFENEEDEGTLIYAAVVHRHGDRTPTAPYQTDPYYDFKYPRGYGELTNAGRVRLFKVGQHLRKRYSVLTTHQYLPETVRLDSSDKDRCLLSAQSFFSGYFMQPAPADKWHEDILWTPIPVHTRPNMYDNFVAMTQNCNYRTILTNEFYKNSPEIKEMCKQFEPLYKYTKQHAGILERLTCGNQEDFLKLLTIHDTLKVQKEQFNFTLPAWANNVFNDTVTAMIGKFFFFEGSDPTIAKYCVGPFFHVLLQDMDYNVHKKPDEDSRPKLHMFAAHDGVIVSLMRSLKMYNDISPPYAAALMFELRETEDDYYIKVHYKNVTEREPYLMHIPECPYPCSLDRFRTIIDPLVPEDWETECLQDELNTTKPTTETTASPPTTATFAPPTSPTTSSSWPQFPSIPTLPTWPTMPTAPPMPKFPWFPQLPSMPPYFGNFGIVRTQTPAADGTVNCQPYPQFKSELRLLSHLNKKSKPTIWRPHNRGPTLSLSPFELT